MNVSGDAIPLSCKGFPHESVRISYHVVKVETHAMTINFHGNLRFVIVAMVPTEDAGGWSQV